MSVLSPKANDLADIREKEEEIVSLLREQRQQQQQYEKLYREQQQKLQEQAGKFTEEKKVCLVDLMPTIPRFFGQQL